MFDERFVIHRYKSTSHAAVVGALFLAGLLLRDYWSLGLLRWDLGIPLVAMALTKLAAMAWYHFRD